MYSTSNRNIVLIAASTFLLLLIAILLSTAIEIRGTPAPVIQIPMAQAARIGDGDDLVSAKGLINGTDFDRGDVYNGTSIVEGVTVTSVTIMTETQDGMIGFTAEPQSSASWDAEGILGPKITAIPTPKPKPRPQSPQLPIVALTYSGAGGPKHCRGRLLAKTHFPPPVETWKNGTCINLPAEARCGVFFSNKGDNCEAQLFNVENCYNTSRSYINTVVFMPEERPVGALWSSMFVRCGVEVPEAKMLDPSILGGALKRPPKGG